MFTLCCILLDNLSPTPKILWKTTCMKLRYYKVLREIVESFGKISEQCFIFLCLVHRFRKTFNYDFKDNLGCCILFRKSQRKFTHVFSKQSKIYQNTHFTKIFERLVYISFKRKICKWISIFFHNFCQQIVAVAVSGSFRVY